MNYLRLKNVNLLIILLLFSFKNFSQNSQVGFGDVMGTILTSGNNATSSSGTVTYSIGQVFYTYIGESVYNVAQGIQHEQKVENLNTKDDIIEVKSEIFVFPNPTTDYVNINMKGVQLENHQFSYQIYDLQGRFIKQSTIDRAETQINLNELSSAIYLLQVLENSIVYKSFKIIKK